MISITLVAIQQLKMLLSYTWEVFREHNSTIQDTESGAEPSRKLYQVKCTLNIACLVE